MDVPVLAGTVAAVVFAIANLPMVWKALRTRDVGSYSLGSIVLINGANAVYSIYVFSLPFGPIWVLHSFYLIASAIMLVLCVRQLHARRARGGARGAGSPTRSTPERGLPTRPAAGSGRAAPGRRAPLRRPARPDQRVPVSIGG